VVGSCLTCSWGCLCAREIELTAGVHLVFQPKFGSKSTLHDTTEQMKLFLAHTIMFVGSIWKNESGWFLFDMFLGLLVATEVVPTAGVHHVFSTQ
jgi:hypothetical protein